MIISPAAFHEALCYNGHMTQKEKRAYSHRLSEIVVHSDNTVTGTCSSCGPNSEIYVKPDGRKSCKQRIREYNAATRERAREKERERYHSRPDGKAYRSKKWLRQRYGITPEELDDAKQAQGNLCAICDREKPLVIDHDHKTGNLRGLLCNDCNTSIGKLGDTVESLTRALDYLVNPPGVALGSTVSDKA